MAAAAASAAASGAERLPHRPSRSRIASRPLIGEQGDVGRELAQLVLQPGPPDRVAGVEDRVAVELDQVAERAVVAVLVAPEAVAAERVGMQLVRGRHAGHARPGRLERDAGERGVDPRRAARRRPRRARRRARGRGRSRPATWRAIAASVHGSRWSACSCVTQTRSTASTSSGRSAGATGRVIPSSSSSFVDSQGSIRTSASSLRSANPDCPSAKISSPPSSGRAVASVWPKPGHRRGWYSAHVSRAVAPGRPTA